MTHWLRKHFYQRPRALPRWWRMPDQYLLRHETRWALRWLTRWPGFYWLASSMGLAVVLAAHALSRFVLPNGNLSVFFVYLAFWLGLIGLWIWLMQQRAFLFYPQRRLEELAVARFMPRQLWPALLAAPVLIPTVLAALSTVLPLTAVAIGKCISAGGVNVAVISTAGLLACSIAACLCVFTFLYALSAQVMHGTFQSVSARVLFDSMATFGATMFVCLGMTLTVTAALAAILVSMLVMLATNEWYVLMAIIFSAGFGLMLFNLLAALCAMLVVTNLKSRDIVEMYHARQERK